MKIEIFSEKVVKPFEFLGLKSEFLGVHIETLAFTWLAMILLFSAVLIMKYFLKKKLNPVALIFEQAVNFLDNLCKESFASHFKYEYFSFVSTIFFFTLSCCIVGLLPFVEEATKDLNTTFALGSMSFLYVQYQKIRNHGFLEFFKEFTQPFFVLLPLNVVGELAKVASMSLRLFGNILGGAIIFLILRNFLSVYKFHFIIFCSVVLVTYFIVNKFIDLKKYKILNFLYKMLLILTFAVAGIQMFFGIFEGFIQSFVLTMLTITYLSVALGQESDSDHKHVDHDTKLDAKELVKG
ncbi:MAG: FoF1 ATP synthase subunit a [Candidatus Babeliales bacterium]